MGLYEEFNTATLSSFKRRMFDVDNRKRKSVWLISFTDVVSLMLAFFVLLFSMKQPDQESWSHISSALTAENYHFYGASLNEGQSQFDRISIENRDRKIFTLNYLEALLKQYLEGKDIARTVTYQRFEDRLVVSWSYQDLSQQLAQSESALVVLGDALSRVDNRIEIAAKPEMGSGVLKMLEAGQGIARILNKAGYNRDILISGLPVSRQLAGFSYDTVGGYDTDRIDLVIFDD